MTDQTAQEPTMEEILASIRRIISEDDAPAETSEAGTDADAAEPEAAVAAAPADDAAAEADEADDDVLELSEPIEVEAVESIGDLDVTGPEAAAEPEPEPEPFPAEPVEEAPEPVAAPAASAEPVADAPDYDTLVGDSASASAASAFAGFASTLRKSDAMDSPATVGPTLDELVRSLLRPMLKDWLDANLPGIVEAQVRKEVERIARNAG